jgi:hypothetical protein
MFGKKKDKPLGKGQVAGPSAAVKVAEPEQPARTPESLEKMSSIGSGMTVVGKLVGDGVVKIFGNVEGEVQASGVLICEGAYVEGNVIAKEFGSPKTATPSNSDQARRPCFLTGMGCRRTIVTPVLTVSATAKVSSASKVHSLSGSVRCVASSAKPLVLRFANMDSIVHL